MIAARGERLLGVAVYDPNAAARNPAWASLRTVAVVPEAGRWASARCRCRRAPATRARRAPPSSACTSPSSRSRTEPCRGALGLDGAPDLEFDRGVDLQAHPGLAARAYVLPLE